MTSPAIAPQKTTTTTPSAIRPASHDSWRESEKFLLGAILSLGSVGKGRQAFAEVLDAAPLKFKDFLTHDLGALWFVMGGLYHDGKEIDLSTVWAEIQQTEKAKNHITMDMLTYLANQKSGSHRTHAEKVLESSVNNNLTKALIKLTELSKDPAIKVNNKIRDIINVMNELNKQLAHTTKSRTTNITQGLEAYYNDYVTDVEQGIVDIGIPTGFPRLDRHTDGWRKKTLNVVAGPPGSGKTVFLMTSALHALMHGQRVLIVEVELDAQGSYRRLLCAFAGIDSNRLKRHQLRGWEQSRLTKAIQKLKAFDKHDRFTLLSMNQPTLDDINIKLDTLMMDGYDIIFFDYAGGAKIEKSHPATSDLDHHRSIYRTIDSWKSTYNVPVVAGAQYGVAGSKKSQKKPSDYSQDMIYSSGFIADNAHTIMFLHPDRPDKDDNKASDSVSLVVAKNRDGHKPLGSNLVVPTWAQMNMFRFMPNNTPTKGVPMALWELHEQQVSASDDFLKDL